MENRHKIINLIKSILEDEKLTNYLAEDTQLSSINFNSLSFIMLVVNIEIEFSVEFDDANLDFRRFTTVGDICEYVEGIIK